MKPVTVNNIYQKYIVLDNMVYIDICHQQYQQDIYIVHVDMRSIYRNNKRVYECLEENLHHSVHT